MRPGGRIAYIIQSSKHRGRVGLVNVLLPSETHLNTPFGPGFKPRDSQKHRSALSAYPHATQELLVISWWWSTFTRPHRARRPFPYPVVDPFPDLFNHTRLSVRDEEERTRYRSLRASYGKRTYNAATESTMVFPVCYWVEGCPKTPSTTHPVIKR